MALGNVDFNTIASTTLKNYRKTLTDNIFDGHPLLYWMKEKKRVRFLDGGEQIVEPLIHTVGDTPAANGGAITDGSYGEWDDIAITPVTTATSAVYDWKSVAATIAISGMEEAKNQGKDRVVNLLEAKIMQAEETLKQNLSTMLFLDTAATTGMTGLGVLIGDETSTVTTVGGIDATDALNTWWRSEISDLTAVASGDLDIRKEVRTDYNNASKGGPDRVDLVLGGQGAYEQYEEDLLPTLRRSNTKMADAGFQNLEIQGVPFVWDYNCPTNEIFGINSKYLGLVGHKNRWFKTSKFTDGLETAQGGNGGAATVVDGRYAVITSYMELTCRNRRRQFHLHSMNLRP